MESISSFKKCFVIMPFSETKNNTEEYWTRHFSQYLKPLVEKHFNGLRVFRSEATRGIITEEIIKNLFEADIVIADLTDYNPNVFWELGVRDSTKHATISIAQPGTEVPFDVEQRGVLYYNKDHADLDFESKLLREIEDCLSDPEKNFSPVLRAVSGRGSLYGLIHKEETLRKLDALESELEYNIGLTETISDCINENKKCRASGGTPTGYLAGNMHTASIELLLTTRYLDIPKYDVINEYYTWFNELNEIMDDWPNNWLAVEQALLEKIKEFKRDKLPNYKEYIKAWRNQVSGIV